MPPQTCQVTVYAENKVKNSKMWKHCNEDEAEHQAKWLQLPHRY